MPKNESDEAGFHGGKRSTKTDSHVPARSKGSGDGAEADSDDYVHYTIKRGSEKFWVMAHRSAAASFKGGEEMLISDIVENSDVYYGKQGEPNRASKAMLADAFGDASTDDIIKTIIKEGSVM